MTPAKEAGQRQSCKSPLFPAQDSVVTKFARRLVKAEWARSIAHAMAILTAMLPGKGELPVKDQSFIAPLDSSRDGRFIIYQERQQLWVLAVSGDAKPYPLKQTIAAYGNAHLSPDGRWLAFVSDETGRAEVYVTRFDQQGERFRISTDGGNNPRWRRDSGELFYLSADGYLMSVGIKPGEKFEAGAPVALFQADPLSPDYDVTADGQRFLFVASAPGTQLLPFAVVLGWMAELKR